MRPYRRPRLSERDLEIVDLALFYSIPRKWADRLPTAYWLQHRELVEKLMVQYAARVLRRARKGSRN